ncbi:MULTISPECIES: phosphohydrolase [unclassified Providencia]|uniref:phosphohydrolase n=1 Tax=unclassified Providencia TaxID=2633465 RepID=UPI00234B4F91|nr:MULTISPECIES: phosphohydrolase [unclassified Providencia]
MDIDHWASEFDNYLLKNWVNHDNAHDIFHLRRVWRTAQTLMGASEQVNPLVVLVACYFHDVVTLPKDHSQRSQASSLSATETLRILTTHFPSLPKHYHDAIAHCIIAHSFSANVEPMSLEAKIVQDADRLEALGAIGLARVFAVSGQLNRTLFDGDDPFAQNRALDDSRWALDHFQAKLLKLPETMQTPMGKLLATQNANYLVQFMAKLSAELSGNIAQFDDDIIARFSLDVN